jgi:hypothetical protein
MSSRAIYHSGHIAEYARYFKIPPSVTSPTVVHNPYIYRDRKIQVNGDKSGVEVIRLFVFVLQMLYIN